MKRYASELLRCGVLGILAAAVAAAGGEREIEVDRAQRRIRVPAEIAPQGTYKELRGGIEYVACAAKGKTYETLFICPVSPLALNAALTALGLRPGRPAGVEADGSHRSPSGPAVRITVIRETADGPRRERVESFILDRKTGKPMPPVGWLFTGSQPGVDPQTGEAVLQVALTANLISLHHRDPTVLLQNPLPAGKDTLRYRPDPKALPRAGTAVTLVLEPLPPEATSLPAGWQQARWLVSGRVQGVGFRVFTQRAARGLGLRGWVRNLDSGEVEVVAVGPADRLGEFAERLARGPRGARVDEVKAASAPADDVGASFEIRPTQ